MKIINYISKRLYFYSRYLNTKKRLLPDFIIIGEAKCGTTSLFKYITQNNKFISPLKKEIHFFDYKYNKGLRWYKSHFPLNGKMRNSGIITGEATPYYLSHPKAFYRIKETLPNVKLIIMLRNPVDRALSSFYNQKRIGLEDIADFKNACSIEKERIYGTENTIFEESDFNYNHKYYSYLNRGIYYDNLSRYLTLFKKDQILILEFDEFFNNVNRGYEKVIDFLNLEEQKIINKVYNKGTYKEMEKDLRIKLLDFYKVHNQKLFNLIGKSYDWDK